MVKYYYDKFTAIGNTSYVEPGWVSQGNDYSPRYSDLAKSYSWNPSTGKFTVNSDFYASGTMIPTGAIGYRLSGTVLYRYSKTDASSLSEYSSNASASTKDSNSASINTTYTKGSLVQAGIAVEDGTYPANGLHTDGHWYVKGAAVGPLPPGTVTTEAYSTINTGGRKLIRLQDGTLVAVVFLNNSFIKVHISKDNGVNWTQAMALGIAASVDVCIVPINAIQVGLLYSYGSSIRYRTLTRNGDNFTAGTEMVLDNPSNPHRVSLEIDPNTGHLYAAWSGQKTPYATSHNIIRSISTDKGVTWSAASFVTDFNVSSISCVFASVVVRNNQPIYIYRMTDATSYTILARFLENGSWVQKTIFLAQNNQNMGDNSAVVDKDGVIHVVWTRSETYNFLWYSKSLDGGKTWSTPAKFVKPGNYPSITVDKNNVVKIVAYQPTSGLLVYTFNNGNWSDYTPPTGVATNPQTLVDNTFKLAFGDIPPIIYMKDSKTVQYQGSFTTNTIPSVSLTSPSNNQTLYENDTINITGDAYDADKDQSVTVFYQIDGEQRKVLATNVSQTQISLSKQLTFKDGKLFDGETALTGTLAEGVAHTLKVWAVDSDNSQSATIERTFYVVPNRAPLLSVDAVVPAGVVDSDKFKISGTSSDPDANANVKVTKKVNANNPVEIYNGPGGAWEFDVSLAELVVGENTIVIEVIDNYGAKTSKTIKLKKNEIKTPILHAVARHKITPPAGSAKGVLLFIERDEDMDLTVELSMTLVGEQEQYETLTANNTAPMPNTNGIVEDTFYFETTEPKDNIILKISTTRPDATVNHKIHLISGAVE
ncbi:sialidase family protein [Lysinibacillus sp. FSL M8-0134]|uniref:sialidase family protein n=1 Tax=Lysinibacillus sp. FSL M8-0134 TaxID=2921717 RepID=UPI00311A5267